MAQNLMIWAALAALATLAAAFAVRLAARRQAPHRPAHGQQGKPTPYVRRKSALLAAAAFLLVGGLGGFFARGVLHLPLPGQDTQALAQAQAGELFRASPLLRALDEAEPARAEELRSRYTHALATHMEQLGGAEYEAQANALETRLRNEACREALAASLSRLPNASDEAAARLAQALLDSLKHLGQQDPLLCLGLLHPASPHYSTLCDNALAVLDGDVRKKLESALALVLASSSLRPQAAPLPSRADAALAEMFSENLAGYKEAYGGHKEVRGLFEALADPAKAQGIAPEVLCAFAQDLLQGLLRMPPTERGNGLRRLLGSN